MTETVVKCNGGGPAVREIRVTGRRDALTVVSAGGTGSLVVSIKDPRRDVRPDGTPGTDDGIDMAIIILVAMSVILSTAAAAIIAVATGSPNVVGALAFVAYTTLASLAIRHFGVKWWGWGSRPRQAAAATPDRIDADARAVADGWDDGRRQAIDAALRSIGLLRRSGASDDQAIADALQLADHRLPSLLAHHAAAIAAATDEEARVIAARTMDGIVGIGVICEEARVAAVARRRDDVDTEARYIAQRAGATPLHS